MKRQPPAPLNCYELWQYANGYVLIEERHPERDTLVEQPATLLTTIMATNWHDACFQRDVFLHGPQDARDYW